MILIHVGYAKAASTTLQKSVFPKLSGINYLGRRYDGSDNIYHRLAEELPNFMHMDDEVAYSAYVDGLRSLLDRIKMHPVNVLSAENFLRPYKIERIAQRLRRLFAGFDAKFIFTVRRQGDIISSRINHDRSGRIVGDASKLIVDDDLPCAYPSCMKFKRRGCPCFRGIKKISLPYYDYDRTISIFESEIGRSRIGIWSFEGIVSRDPRTVQQMASDLGVDAEIVSALLRQAKPENVGKDEGAYREMKKIWLAQYGARVFERFGASNRVLAERHGLDLERYDYY